MTTVSIDSLLKTGAHFGHLTFKWHPRMNPYLIKAKQGIHLIDLRATLVKLKEAYEYSTTVGMRGGKIMLVGTKPAAAEVLKKIAQQTNSYYVVHRWLGGTLTNFQTIKQSVNRIKQLEDLAGPDGSYPGILKKEAGVLEKKRRKMQLMLGGIREMRKMPAVMFIVDLNREKIALQEAKVLGIPTIAIVDSNVNPDLVDYPIPSNDDSHKSVEMIASIVMRGYMEGLAQQKEARAQAEAQEETADNAINVKDKNDDAANLPSNADSKAE